MLPPLNTTSTTANAATISGVVGNSSQIVDYTNTAANKTNPNHGVRASNTATTTTNNISSILVEQPAAR